MTEPEEKPKDAKPEEPKKRKNFSTPTGDRARAEHRRTGGIAALIAGALGGAAYGVNRGAEKFLPKETRIALDAMAREHQRLMTSRALSGINETTDNDVVKTYAETASRLANSSVAGMKGHELIKLLRSKLPIKDKWTPHFSDAHYNAFARGPAYGAAQIIDESAENVRKYYHPDKSFKKYVVEKFTPKFGEKLNETSRDQGANPMDVGPSLRESLAYRGETMGADKQTGVLNDIIYGGRFNKDRVPVLGGFSDHFKKLKGRVASEVMTNSFNNYTGVGHKAKGVYNILSNVLPGVIGVAGAGVGAYGLVKLLKSLKRTAYEKRMIAKAEKEGMEWTEKEDVEKTAGFNVMKPIRQALGRVVTNVIQPQGYDLRTKLKDAMALGVMPNLKAIWNDRPAYLQNFNAAPSYYRELPYRRMFDLPARKFGVGYLTKNGPGSFRINRGASGQTPGFDMLNHVVGTAAEPLLEHAKNIPIPAKGIPFTGHGHELLGNYGGIARSNTLTSYKDRWDFDLNPGEKVFGSPVNPVRWLVSKIVKPIVIEGDISHGNPLEWAGPLKSLPPTKSASIAKILKRVVVPTTKGVVNAVKKSPHAPSLLEMPVKYLLEQATEQPQGAHTSVEDLMQEQMAEKSAKPKWEKMWRSGKLGTETLSRIDSDTPTTYNHHHALRN